LTATLRRNLLRKIVSSGYQISPDALEYIIGLDAPEKIIDFIVAKGKDSELPTVLSQVYLASLIDNMEHSKKSPDIRDVTISEGEDTEELPSMLEIELNEIEPISRDQPISLDENIIILKNPIFERVGSSGSIEDFLALFKDRFKRIEKIYMGRIDTRNAITPADARKRRSFTRRRFNPESGRRERPPTFVVLGIVSNKSVSKSRNIILELEGEMGDSITCIVPAGSEGLERTHLQEKGNSVLLDETVCISGYVDEDGRMIADDVLFPDIPTVRKRGRATRDVYAAFISDLHMGSAEFLEDEFDRFIDWLNGRDVDTEDKEMVERIRFLFCAGDLVDGIGVYPSQREDLLIENVVEQYEFAFKKLKRIPKHIKIIAIPGNHDADRQALPKPPISEQFAGPLYKLGDRLIMLGDPSHIEVENVKVLLTHGDSMDDLVVNTPGASYLKPAIGMKELLKKRHLAPIYGGKTELAPLHRDWLVIDTPPDIVHFGHAHKNALDEYRGVQIINSGTFQSQTDFMRKQGIVPTPGLVTVVNLRTGQPQLKAFYDFSKMDEV